jgi:hypothetical protein
MKGDGKNQCGEYSVEYAQTAFDLKCGGAELLKHEHTTYHFTYEPARGHRYHSNTEFVTRKKAKRVKLPPLPRSFIARNLDHLLYGLIEYKVVNGCQYTSYRSTMAVWLPDKRGKARLKFVKTLNFI